MSKFHDSLKLAFPHVSKRDIEKIISSYHSMISEDLEDGERVYLHQIGTLYVKDVAPRAVNLPHIKGKVEPKPSRRIRIKPSATITRKLKAK